jgi:hypothetical protein
MDSSIGGGQIQYSGTALALHWYHEICKLTIFKISTASSRCGRQRNDQNKQTKQEELINGNYKSKI